MRWQYVVRATWICWHRILTQYSIWFSITRDSWRQVCPPEKRPLEKVVIQHLISSDSKFMDLALPLAHNFKKACLFYKFLQLISYFTQLFPGAPVFTDFCFCTFVCIDVRDVWEWVRFGAWNVGKSVNRNCACFDFWKG